MAFPPRVSLLQSCSCHTAACDDCCSGTFGGLEDALYSCYQHRKRVAREVCWFIFLAVAYFVLSQFRYQIVNFRDSVWHFQASIFGTIFAISLGYFLGLATPRRGSVFALLSLPTLCSLAHTLLEVVSDCGPVFHLSKLSCNIYAMIIHEPV